MPDGSDSESTLIEPDYSAASTPTAPPHATVEPEELDTSPSGLASDVPVPSMVPAGPQHGALVAMTQSGEVKLSYIFANTPGTLVRERERGGKGITEVFTVSFGVDAAGALASGDQRAIAHGIHPDLAVLDQLFRESWLLLLFGPSRLIPMTPMAMNVIETAFDDALNPIRAEITFRAERITLTSDLNLGRYVNAAAGTTHGLMRLYTAIGLPSFHVD